MVKWRWKKTHNWTLFYKYQLNCAWHTSTTMYYQSNFYKHGNMLFNLMVVFASFYARYLQANMNGLKVEIDIWQLIVWPPMFVIVIRCVNHRWTNLTCPKVTIPSTKFQLTKLGSPWNLGLAIMKFKFAKHAMLFSFLGECSIMDNVGGWINKTYEALSTNILEQIYVKIWLMI
jgi:hypothetical protein